MTASMSEEEVLALLIPEPDTKGGPSPMATAVVRDPHLGLRIQSVVPSRQLLRRALVTARADNGVPIIDPVTREVIGYEFGPRMAAAY